MLTAPPPAAHTSFSAMWWRGTTLRVRDGDTVEVLARGPWHGRQEIVVRLSGVQAPETRAPASLEERRAGEAARAYLAALVEGQDLLVRTLGPDAYHGRWVGDVVVVRGEDRIDVAQALIGAGHATTYDGRGKAPRWPWRNDT